MGMGYGYDDGIQQESGWMAEGEYKERKMSFDEMGGEGHKGTPYSKKKHLLKLKNKIPEIEDCKGFVLGISGGDCAGKWELTQYLFQHKGGQWMIRGTDEPVAILRQEYFLMEANSKQFTAAGTDWNQFYDKALSLKIGNAVTITKYRNQPLHIPSCKLLVIEGSHILMTTGPAENFSCLFNLRIYIDSDSDIRLSRRVFRDTYEQKKPLSESITQYLEYIKVSYEKEIEPSKKESDIIIPHFGGGYTNPRCESADDFSNNVKNACSLIITHLRDKMKAFDDDSESDQSPTRILMRQSR